MKKTIVKYYTKYWLMILLSTAFLVCQALCELQLPTYMSDIITSGIAVGDMDQIWSIGIKMLAVALGCAVSAILVGYFSSTVGAALARDLRYDVFAKVGSFSSAEFDKFSQSSLITRGTNDITQIQIFSIMFLRLVMFAPVMGIGGIIKAVRFSSGMSGLVIVVAVAVAVLLVAIITMIATVLPKFKQMQTKIDRVNQVAQDELAGLMVIRAFNTQAHEEKRFEEANKDLTKTSLFAYRVMAILNPAITMVMFGVSIAVVWIAAVSAKDISEVGNMIAFIQYAMQIIMSFMMLSMAFVLMPRAAVSAERVADVLDTPASVVTPEHPTDANVDGDIVFDNVSFKYSKDAERFALEGVNLHIKSGQTIGILGGTGSSKSTLVNLIPRLYDVTEGAVYVGGVNVKDYDLDALRNKVAMVLQKNVLFSGTIKENLRWGKEDATDDEMLRVCKLACADDFIQSFPDKYDTYIEQGGTNVSGGQKQRLCIARTLLKKPKILIFDDSTSAVDTATEAKIRAALRALGDVTKIIIAQRITSVMGTDQIIVLDDGRIHAVGTHRELLESDAIYQEIYHSQMKGGSGDGTADLG